MIHISVLGPIGVARDGLEVPIRSARQRALLAALVADAGQTVSVDRLVDAIWGDAAPADARAALQTHVSRLRRLLGDGVVRTEATGYRVVASDGVEIDAVTFEEIVDEARGLLAHGRHRAAAERFAAALACWRGDAYGEFADRDFARPVAARLDELRDGATEDHGEALLGAGRAADAVSVLDAHTARHPLRERAAALLMRALYADGRQAEALEVFGRYRHHLGEELGLEPSAALRDLEAAIVRHEVPALGAEPGAADADEAGDGPEPERTVPARALPPVALTPLVGREVDLAAVAELLQHVRIVTVTGPGGVGKTRLVQAVAGAVADRYPDGVWWCDLSSATPDDVTVIVASTLGVQHHTEASLLARLVEFLRPERALVVLDGCEHVVDAVAELVEAIATGTTDVTVLATTQEALGVTGEHRWPLAPFPPSVRDDPGDPNVVLFVQRATAVDPSFTLGADDVARVSAICRRIDGLPLAIELAAGRVATMDLDEIAAGLDERFDLLAHRRRAGVGRHRSLRATVEWSLGLLDEEHRDVLAELAVFAGSFDVDDVAAVSARPRERIRDVLATLVERSLVVTEHGAPARRFHLLETLRAHGAERLAGDAWARLRDRHAAHVTRLVQEAAPGLITAREPVHARRIDRLVPELRIAHRHLVEHHATARLLDLWSPMYHFLQPRLRSELYLHAEETVDLARDAWSDDPRFARVAGIAATGAWQRGSFRRAQALAGAGLAAAGDDPRLRFAADVALADTALMQGDLAASQAGFTAAAERAAAIDDVGLQALGLSFAAVPAAYAGDLETGSTLARHALELAHAIGAPSVLGWAHYAAGEVLLEFDPHAASEHLEAALEWCEQSGADFLRGVALVSAVTVQGRTGDPEGALARYPELVEHWARAGSWVQQWTTLRNLAELLVRSGHDRPAAVLLGATATPTEGAAVFGADADRLRLARETIVERLGEEETLEAITEGAGYEAPQTVRFARETLARLTSPALEGSVAGAATNPSNAEEGQGRRR